VFDQFKMTWCVQVETQPQHLTLSPAPEPNPAGTKAEFAKYFSAEIPTSHPHDLDRDDIEELYPAGEEVAHERLKAFISDSVLEYHNIRSQVSHQGSNPLAPYIANGILSHRQCVSMARSVNNNKVMVGNEGVKLWVTEFIWKVCVKGSLPKCEGTSCQNFSL
jgi:deoxyribodipyrimidine photo-lyase